jgi:hypothetical protein
MVSREVRHRDTKEKHHTLTRKGSPKTNDNPQKNQETIPQITKENTQPNHKMPWNAPTRAAHPAHSPSITEEQTKPQAIH